MSDYSKEDVAIVDSSASFAVGDKVKLSAFYLTNYGGVAHLQDKAGTVRQITKRTVNADALEKTDKAMYAAKYGVLPVYEVLGLFVEYEEHQGLMMGSPFGFDK